MRHFTNQRDGVLHFIGESSFELCKENLHYTDPESNYQRWKRGFEGKHEILVLIAKSYLAREIPMREPAFQKYSVSLAAMVGYVKGQSGDCLRKKLSVNGGAEYVPTTHRDPRTSGTKKMKAYAALAAAVRQGYTKDGVEYPPNPDKADKLEEKLDVLRTAYEAEKEAKKKTAIDFSLIDEDDLVA